MASDCRYHDETQFSPARESLETATSIEVLPHGI